MALKIRSKTNILRLFAAVPLCCEQLTFSEDWNIFIGFFRFCVLAAVAIWLCWRVSARGFRLDAVVPYAMGMYLALQTRPAYIMLHPDRQTPALFAAGFTLLMIAFLCQDFAMRWAAKEIFGQETGS